jgi:hypothetical protein
MLNESIILKDGKGNTREVTYIGPHFLDNTLRHKVKNSNGHEFLVDRSLLSPMDASDISTIPVSIEHYARPDGD